MNRKQRRPGTDVPDSHQEARRNFLKTVAGAGAAFAGLAVAGCSLKDPEALAAEVLERDPAATPDFLPPAVEGEVEDVLIRMQRELRLALQKPKSERRWVMVIDVRKCTGCHACTISCVSENRLPPGVVYRPVIEEELGEYPNVSWRFTPRPCMQCDEPPCVPVCPVKATWKSEDGIVDIDYTKCIGCRYCLVACPYHARTADFGDNWTDGTPGGGKTPYETTPSFEYGREWRRGKHRILGLIAIDRSPSGNARKCHFCRHRIEEQGLLPQCVSSCIGRATFFGDAGDSDSLVAELITRPNAMRLKEELAIKPRVYYLF